MLELDESLLADLEAGTVVVPSMQRATALQVAHAAAQLELGRRLWRSPHICSYPGWLQRAAVRFAEEGAPIARMLRPAEEWLHWRDAARAASESASVPFDDPLAESLHRSAQLLHEWRIPRSAVHRAGTGESALLARTLHRFESLCADLRVTASYRLPELVRGWQPRRPVAFAGFIDPTPAQRDLMPNEPGGARRASRPTESFIADASTPAEECALAAQWCAARLSGDPRSRLLVIIPDLVQRRATVLRTFEQALSPHSMLHESSEHVRPLFAIEGGQPLASLPLVHHALTGLRLITDRLDFASFSAWLRSSFWASPSESDRSRLDLWLRTRLRPEVDPAQLHEQLAGAPVSLAAAAAQLRAMLNGALAAIENASASSAQWACRFGDALGALGWPGSRPLNSAEHQTRSRFMELLDELSALAPSLRRLSAIEAVATLHRLATRVAFEPATGDVAITLTDSLVDPIVGYDGIWVAGLHADFWPSATRFDPFIPLGAQRAAGITACSAAGRLRQARELLQVWRVSTAQLVMSWAHRSDESEHLASPLLHEIEGVQPLRTGPSPLPLARVVRAGATLEAFEDPSGAPWPQSSTLPAGTRCLDYQNLCPFRAYAELRLGCAPLESPSLGVDYRSRGKLLHRALEHLWTHLGGSAGLEAHRGQARHALIDDCVARAVRECFDPATLRDASRAVAREHRRAVRLLAQLCELEEQRQPFRVQALEARRQLNMAGASLEVRLDRIDELSDGTLAIFDYKSGKAGPMDWLSERPSNPQLLVYLRAVQAPVSALVAAHLTAAKVSYRGLADRDERLPEVRGLAERWPQELVRWRAYIEALASDFIAGRAVPDPLGDACRTCHLHSFCRIADTEPIRSGTPQDD